MDFRERLHIPQPGLPPPGAFAFDSRNSHRQQLLDGNNSSLRQQVDGSRQQLHDSSSPHLHDNTSSRQQLHDSSSQAAGQKLLQAMIMQGAAAAESPWTPWREAAAAPGPQTQTPTDDVALRLCKQEVDAPPPTCSSSMSSYAREEEERARFAAAHREDASLGRNRSSSRVVQIPCSFCRADFSTVDALMAHLKKKACLGGSSSASESVTIAVCPFAGCSYQAGRRTVVVSPSGQSHQTSWSQCLNILANHIRAKHTLEAEFECRVCGKRLVTAMAHRYHVKQHDNGAKFYCQACGRFFPHAVRDQHYAKSHDHVKSFECTRCGKCLSSKSSLELHQQVHDAAYRYRCEVCGKQFHQKNNWSIHLGRKHGLVPPPPVHKKTYTKC